MTVQSAESKRESNDSLREEIQLVDALDATESESKCTTLINWHSYDAKFQTTFSVKAFLVS